MPSKLTTAGSKVILHVWAQPGAGSLMIRCSYPGIHNLVSLSL